MLRLMTEKGRVRVVCDQVGTPTAASSISEVVWKFVSRPDLHGVYHWSDAGVASWFDFAVAIQQIGERLGMLGPGVGVEPIPSTDFPTPARRPPYSVLDSTKTWSALKTAPRHWSVGVEQTLLEILSRA